MHRYSPLAAATLALASVMTYFVSNSLNHTPRMDGPDVAIHDAIDREENLKLIQKACDDRYVMAPHGGRLDAVDGLGNIMGPCILKHTDVDVQVSGFLSRVSVKQIYVNPHSTKVETVYTFPLSERAAVDRMKMTIGNREIEGQVKERAEAQRIYQEAKAQGRIASLLEQERPNIFTQSIANIEPQAQIAIEISYVEVLQQRDGEYSFSFPTTIAPRYIPGEMRTWEMNPPPAPVVKPPASNLPPGFVPRRGIVLIGPAQLVEMQPGDTSKATLTTSDLGRELGRARAVRPLRGAGGTVWYNFTVKYDDGSKETGSLYTNGTGTVNNRWFYSAELASIGSEVPVAIPDLDGGARPFPLPAGRTPHDGGAGPDYYGGRAEVGSTGQPGDNVSPPTTSVPDANRITPMPVSPDRRAGHDISITVHINSGGPSVTDIKSALHTIDVNPGDVGATRRLVDGPVEASRKTITLRNLSEIPNRDFSLSWKMAGGLDQPVVLTHTAPQGNFFFVSVLPPERADDTIAVPREITFVLDRSGSMKGFKIEQAKAIIDATLATMRPYDTFNVLGFSSTFETLWSSPRRATAENIAEARAFYGRNEGSGATEMLKVVSAALAPNTGAAGQPVAPAPVAISPEDLANLPADGRAVIVDVPSDRLLSLDDQGNERLPNRSIKMNTGAPDLKVRIRHRVVALAPVSLRLVGAWVTENGERILAVTQVEIGDAGAELTVAELLKLPADDRSVTVTVVPSSVEAPAPDDGQIHAPPPTRCWRIRDYSGHEVEMLNASGIQPVGRSQADVCYRVTGRWGTLNGRRLFAVDTATRGFRNDGAAVTPAPATPSAKPLRIVAFITDGEVGNDMEVLAAIRRHRGDARVFSFAIGNSPNRYLLDGMARLGRGEVDYVPLNADPAEIIKRFTQRVTNPVLTDIKVQFSPNIQPVDVLTALGGGGGAGERVGNADFIPDLYDQKPVIIVGRYNAAGAGAITLTGNAAGGPWSKTINVNLPATEPKNSTIATLWARTKVESIMDDSLTSVQRGSLNPEQRNAIVSLGESFSLVTQFTSFVAVDRLRVTIDGKSRLVQIPIEFPQGDEWSGYFGTPPGDRSDLTKLMLFGGHISTEGIDDAGYNFVNPRGFSPTGFFQDSLGLTSTLADGDVATSADRLYDVAASQDVLSRDLAAIRLQVDKSGRETDYFGLALNYPDGYPANNLGAYRVSGGAQPDVSGAAARYSLPPLQPSTGTPGDPKADTATAFRRDLSPRPGDAGTTDLRAVHEQAPAAKPGNTGDRARGAEAGRDALPAKAAPPAPGASPSPAPSEGSRVKGLEDALAGVPVDGKSADEAKDAVKVKKSSFPKRGERQEERSKSPAPASEAEKAAPRPKELPLPPSGGGGPGGSSPAPPAPPAPSAAPAPLTPPAPSSPEAAPAPASSAVPDAPAPARNEVAESAPVSSLDTLRTLVSTAQLAPNDADRLGRIAPSNAADQKLIDAYVAEADSVARVIESLKAKAQARVKAIDLQGDDGNEPVPAAEPNSRFDSSTGTGEPAAGTSHDPGNAAATAPVSTPGSAAAPIKPVARLVRAEEVAMHIASLAKRNKLDEARTWAVAFADVAKENDIAQEMRGVFSDDTLKDDARAAKLVQLGQQAATRLATLIRENRIRTVMQPELASIALDASYKGGFPEGATKVNGGLLVSLVVQALGDDTFKALRAAGLTIEMSDTDTRVVIGTVALDHLDDLALVPAVNRIEMTK